MSTACTAHAPIAEKEEEKMALVFFTMENGTLQAVKNPRAKTSASQAKPEKRYIETWTGERIDIIEDEPHDGEQGGKED